ncbi:MAG: DNA-processing protein DprA [bacterium]
MTESKTERIYWSAVNSVSGMHPDLFFRLLEHFGTMQALWEAPASALEADDVLSPVMREHILSARKDRDARREVQIALEKGVKIVTMEDDDYPVPLRTIPQPPPVLYIKGKWEKTDERSIAIVGSRRCTQYGRDLASEIAEGLAKQSVTVVSGLAAGIDTWAHRGALSAGGRTIAVLGSGIDYIYPPLNKRLAEEIAGSGAIITEFPFGEKPEKRNFPRRNRIISGLTLGTIVIEARPGSGALITAEYAAAQGRRIFAVPGDVKTELNRGPHQLIRSGAALVESAEHVLQELGIEPTQEQIHFEPELEGREQLIYSMISTAPCSFDEICARTSSTASEVSSTLLMLEMKNLIRQLPGKMYVKQR